MNPVLENRRTLRARVWGCQARIQPNVLSPHVISELHDRATAELCRLFEEELRRRQNLHGEPERLEQRDFVTRCSAASWTDENLADLGANVPVGNRPFAQCEKI